MLVPVAAAFGALALYLLLRPGKRRLELLRPGRFALIGDSLGVGIEPQLNHLLAQRGITLDGRAVGATHASQWLGAPHRASLDAALAAGAHVVLVSLGTNDCYLDSTYCTKLQSNLQQLAGVIRAEGAVPVFLDPGKLPWSAARVAGMRSAIQQAGGVALMNPPDFPKSDGIHYSPAGNEQWAQWVVGELVKL